MSGFPAQNQAQKGLHHYTASKAQEKSIFGGEMDVGKTPRSMHQLWWAKGTIYANTYFYLEMKKKIKQGEFAEKVEK